MSKHAGTAVRQQTLNYLAGLQYWSVITAYGLAASEGIKLTEQHLEMLEWLRHDFDRYGVSGLPTFPARLDRTFAKQGGYILFHRLFPRDPEQALRIAGLVPQEMTLRASVKMH